MPDKLTKRQRDVLEMVEQWIAEEGHSPTVREVATQLGISPATAFEHVQSLLKKRYLRRSPGRDRTLEPVRALGQWGRVSQVPLLGSVPAGEPRLAVEEAEEHLSLPEELAERADFALCVKGQSMLGAGILDGDTVLVRKAEAPVPNRIVVVLVGEEATVKRLHWENDRWWLVAEHPGYPRIPLDEHSRLLGEVVGLWRAY